ncbi:MAG: O-antigen ligase family protein [Gaiellaceae bacterium]
MILALALPVLFLHVRYQPGFSVGFGSTRATAYLSDIAVWAVALAALLAGLRDGFARLRGGRPLWIAGLLYLGWIGVAVAYGAARAGYSWHVHAVTAAKFAEYALLAAALPLILRRRADLEPLLVSVVVWSVVATAVGLLQFFGLSILHAWPAGRRQPSLLGHNDFAALSGMAYAAGLVAPALGPGGLGRRGPALVAAVAGGIGLVLAGATAGLIGVGAATLVLAGLGLRDGRRRGAATAILATLVVGLGIVALRGGDYDQFLRFVGVKPNKNSTNADVQTYSQRTLLVYIGARVFVHHPFLGVGFEGSGEYASYGPELAAARRRFPHVAPLAFPARGRSYGVQNLYVQTLADLGIIGAAALVALILTGVALAGSAALSGHAVGALALAWLLVALGLWLGQGYVAGLPLDAATWLALGLAAASASWRRGRA